MAAPTPLMQPPTSTIKKCGARAKGGAPPPRAESEPEAAGSDRTQLTKLTARLISGQGCSRLVNLHAARIAPDRDRLLFLIVGRIDNRE